jgi:hypothetical protein
MNLKVMIVDKFSCIIMKKKGKNTNKFDGRPMLGLPDYFRTDKK